MSEGRQVNSKLHEDLMRFSEHLFVCVADLACSAVDWSDHSNETIKMLYFGPAIVLQAIDA